MEHRSTVGSLRACVEKSAATKGSPSFWQGYLSLQSTFALISFTRPAAMSLGATGQRSDLAGKTIATVPHHRPTQLVQPGPSRLVAAEPQLSLEAQSTHAVLLAGEEPHRQKPRLQRFARVLENRARRQRPLPFAGATSTDVLATSSMDRRPRRIPGRRIPSQGTRHHRGTTGPSRRRSGGSQFRERGDSRSSNDPDQTRDVHNLRAISPASIPA